MVGPLTKFSVLWTALLIGSVAGAQPAGSAAEPPFGDDEGCLICHKYPMIGRITEDGVLRSYYVVSTTFGRTVHRNVPCRDCHTGIEKLPHDPVKEGVTCDTECHSVKNPATGELFSHKGPYNVYKESVHARSKTATGADADKPYCITCHTNPLYNPAEPVPPARIVDRCVVCHEDRKFVERWYRHTERRIREVKRSSGEIVGLCLSCHNNHELVQRRMTAAKADGRELGRKFAVAGESYLGSFHGKMVSYGFDAAPDCLDCHANHEDYFLSVHEIRPSRDPLSPVNADRRVETCRRCHIYADANYAKLDPHPGTGQEHNPFRYRAEEIYNLMSIVVIIGLVGLSLFETFGRRRDGVNWRLRDGSSWRRKSRRGRDRVFVMSQTLTRMVKR